MIIHTFKRDPSYLSWRKQYPINYDTGPSEEDLERLRKKIERDKKELENE
jgi:hypothetical protein